MGSLPEDDGPTMTGLAEDRRAAVPADDDLAEDDSDDTTSAHSGPPTSKSEPPGHEEEDRTVQQKVSPPQALPARKPPPSATHKPPTPAAGAPPPSADPIPSSSPRTQHSAQAAQAAPASAAPMTALADTEPSDLTDEAELEDSITATAPRISNADLGIVIPGRIEIRTVEDDDLLDETEVRTRPGHIPLTIPAALRAPAQQPGPSQLPPPRPAAGRPPSIAPTMAVPVAPRVDSAPTDDDDDDDDDDGVTREGPAPRVGSSTDLGEPYLLATGPETVPQASSPRTQSAPEIAHAHTKRAGMAEPIVADAADEPPTRPGVESVEADEPATRPGVEGAAADDPPTRPGIGDPAPRSKRAGPVGSSLGSALGSYANEDDDDEESITERSLLIGPADAEDSVTAQAPAVPISLVEAAMAGKSGVVDARLDDGTDGTTQKVKKARPAAGEPSPADGEAESITTQAPGPLTNILRVIASGSSPDTDSGPPAPLDDEEPPENRTAVMVNAPLKRIISEIDARSAAPSPLPDIRPTGPPLTHGPQGSAAPRLAATSESGLRVARPVSGSNERAAQARDGSGPPGEVRSSGYGPAGALASDGSISAPIDVRAQIANDMQFVPGQPSLHDIDLGKGPRYGVLVAVVAVISVIVPVTLYLALRQGSDPGPPPQVSELASEIEKHDPPRAKAERGKNGKTLLPPEPSASGSSSAKAGGKNGGPLKR